MGRRKRALVYYAGSLERVLAVDKTSRVGITVVGGLAIIAVVVIVGVIVLDLAIGVGLIALAVADVALIAWAWGQLKGWRRA